MATDIHFVVPGRAQPTSSAAGAVRGRLKASVAVGARRGSGDAVRLSARVGEDVVVLGIAGGPTLVLHPEAAAALMRAQSAGAQRSGDADGDVAVPAQLGWPGLEAASTRAATRGWLGEVALNAFDIVKGVFTEHGVSIASALVTRKVDGRVEAGVYELSSDELAPLKGSGRLRRAVPAADGPMLVLVHGTFVDTASTFAKLWTMHPQAVARLFAHYGGRVYALDHPTLTQSPIGNALTLVDALPDGARLHLLTHSRGGVVAEVLARACSGLAPSADELALFADTDGASPRDYSVHRRELQELIAKAQAKKLRVERVRARRLPGARHAARRRAARRLPVGAEVGARAGRRAGAARTGRLPERGRATPRRPGRTARPGGDDPRQPGGAAG